jgi:hypothetical protein
MNAERYQVHSLVDQLAPSQLSAVRSLLAVMLDPVANAPIDDEPESNEERLAVARSVQLASTQ